MSRCFPYPPPGYTLSRAKNEAMIESIKLQNERENQKSQEQRKKDKRREKKAKKEERKKREKEKTNKNIDASGIVGSQNAERICLGTTKKLEAGIEKLERSSLTEEHWQPIDLVVPSSSSDSTQNSNKRKIDSSQTDGQAIFIRLPSDHQNKSRKQLSPAPFHTVCNTGQSTSLATKENPNRLPSIQRGAVSADKSEVKPRHMGAATSTRRVESQYRSLFENWAPSGPQDPCSFPDDLNWLLFKDNNQHSSSEKLQRSLDGGLLSMPCSRSSALWPRAEYLHEISAFALPFAFPY